MIASNLIVRNGPQAPTRTTFKCPNCAAPSFTLRQRVSASAPLPHRCSNCSTLVAAVPGLFLELLYAFLETAVLIGSIVVCLFVGSWWPVVVGGVLAVPVLPSLMRLQSPFVVVPASSVKKARLKVAAIWVAIVAAVVLAGVFSS